LSGLKLEEVADIEAEEKQIEAEQRLREQTYCRASRGGEKEERRDHCKKCGDRCDNKESYGDG